VFIVDFHIHSKYSLATSKLLVPEYLEYWAKVKGIQVIGTGDCTHPGWLRDCNKQLTPAENGLYKLKSEFQHPETYALKQKEDVYFMYTAEISSIYKKNGKVRKIHQVCVFPSYEVAHAFHKKLDQIGNVRSDGRPILGLDAKDILEMVLESHPESYLIPAHIWTPWFSVLGSKSGFDTLEECYEDLTPHIFAVETGLSSDPPMNRRCSMLDRYKLVSNSDAHSPDKLGREANLFNTECSYSHILQALKTPSDNPNQKHPFLGTIEFFPEEGKYHHDGHRDCNVSLTPEKTKKLNSLCPKCNKPVTVGVAYRVHELADRSESEIPKTAQTHHSIIPLPEILCEIKGIKNPRSKSIQKIYFDMIHNLGSEFHILLNADIEEIKHHSGPEIARSIQLLRQEKVYKTPGYDGVFGTIKVNQNTT
jgi:DNA helicase II / ATP-dependent DNA helicase PcrA